MSSDSGSHLFTSFIRFKSKSLDQFVSVTESLARHNGRLLDGQPVQQLVEGTVFKRESMYVNHPIRKRSFTIVDSNQFLLDHVKKSCNQAAMKPIM